MQMFKKFVPALKLAVAVAGIVLAVLTLSSAPRASASPASATTSATGTSGTAAEAAEAPAATTVSPGTDQSPTNNADSSGYTTTGGSAAASPVSAASPTAPQSPTAPGQPATTSSSGSTISVNLGGSLSKPSESITIIIGLTLLAVAPSLLILLTSFTRIIIVLSLTRQALGLQSVPPNQLLAGLALFISLFIMSPVISQINNQAIQPYMAGKITSSEAYTEAQAPIKKWMLDQTQADDLAIFEHGKLPKSPSDLPMSAVIPAFGLSEMRTAFIIGFVIFIPFLVIDLVVSATLMSLGMMMLPPSLVSLPFKLLLFVLVDGWALVVQSLIASFHP